MEYHYRFLKNISFFCILFSVNTMTIGFGDKCPLRDLLSTLFAPVVLQSNN